MSESEADNLANLIEAAVFHLDDEEQNPKALTGWAAVSRLQRFADTETLSAAIALTQNPDTRRRRVGAAILGQLDHDIEAPDGVFRNERYCALERLVQDEIGHGEDPEVLGDALVAMGHLNDSRVLSIAGSLIAHASATVRFGVVSALSKHDEEAAINGLIQLSSDCDEEVRDWATFGLGQLIEADTPAIRAALHARLDDLCAQILGEAIEGLATRGDQSVLPILIRELHDGVSLPLLDAATALATPDLCEALVAARKLGLVIEASHGPFDLSNEWTEAMHACGC